MVHIIVLEGFSLRKRSNAQSSLYGSELQGYERRYAGKRFQGRYARYGEGRAGSQCAGTGSDCSDGILHGEEIQKAEVKRSKQRSNAAAESWETGSPPQCHREMEIIR